jgi:purine-binding chemotaxis protein CheW
METRKMEMHAKSGQYLTFTLRGQAYGRAIATVCEINRMTRISPVPQVPDFVAGVMNLRGKVVPVVDLARRFGFPACVPTRETCIIVVEGSCGQVGNIVDSVSGVVDLSAEKIQNPLAATNQENSFVIGLGQVDDGVIILMDASEVLSRNEMMDLRSIHEALTQTQRVGETP